LAIDRATGLTIPLTVVTLYYLVLGGGTWLILQWNPGLSDYLPIGAIDNVMPPGGQTSFEEVILSGRSQAASNLTTLAIAIGIAIALMIPVSWVYLLTHARKDVDASFVQTILILPVIVAGVAMIVQNSIPLAFSLAGIVAAIRFRLTLKQPAQTLYIFTGITVGLAAGISALEVAIIVSIVFAYASMAVWKLDYGDHLDGPFLSFFTGHSRD
jgi:hypothetical protein